MSEARLPEKDKDLPNDKNDDLSTNENNPTNSSLGTPNNNEDKNVNVYCHD